MIRFTKRQQQVLDLRYQGPSGKYQTEPVRTRELVGFMLGISTTRVSQHDWAIQRRLAHARNLAEQPGIMTVADLVELHRYDAIRVSPAGRLWRDRMNMSAIETR